MSHWICWNGDLCEKDLETTLLQDQGFLLGDGLFETLRIHKQKILFCQEHWQRLFESAQYFSLHFPYSLDDILQQSNLVIAKNQINEGILRWTLSRGIPTQRLALQSEQTQLLIETLPLPPQIQSWKIGFCSWTRSADCPLFRHKTLSYLENLKALDEGRSKQLDEVIFCSERQILLEGTRSHLFWVKNQKVYTPSLNLAILRGITRKQIIDKLDAQKIEVIETMATKSELFAAESIFMTNSLWGVIPVSHLENKKLMNTFCMADILAKDTRSDFEK